ncbi:topoisomerase C-terminal repeat-containing protein [Flavobacterium sp.]|uniref:topoisomerase C-terminal repeat-containing protein n=1 Tax=Flavobacterium sp. TaxID=239 RepID=UPI003D6A7A58
MCGVQLSIKEIENLITKGKTSLIKDMKSKSGKKFNAFIVLNEDWKTTFEFEIQNSVFILQYKY